MEVLPIAGGGSYYGVDEFGEFALVKSAYATSVSAHWTQSHLVNLVLTDEELRHRLLVDGPLFVTNGGLQGRIDRFDIDSSRDDLTLDGLRVGRRSRHGDGLRG